MSPDVPKTSETNTVADKPTGLVFIVEAGQTVLNSYTVNGSKREPVNRNVPTAEYSVQVPEGMRQAFAEGLGIQDMPEDGIVPLSRDIPDTRLSGLTGTMDKLGEKGFVVSEDTRQQVRNLAKNLVGTG